jgi:hypothetical protein
MTATPQPFDLRIGGKEDKIAMIGQVCSDYKTPLLSDSLSAFKKHQARMSIHSLTMRDRDWLPLTWACLSHPSPCFDVHVPVHVPHA